MSKGRQVYQHVGQHLLQCRRDLHIAPSFQWRLTTIRAPGGASMRTFGTTPQTQRPQHPNPGNFANRPKEELKEIGRKGGQRGGRATGVGGFHDMDPDKQVSVQETLPLGANARSRAVSSSLLGDYDDTMQW